MKTLLILLFFRITVTVAVRQKLQFVTWFALGDDPAVGVSDNQIHLYFIHSAPNINGPDPAVPDVYERTLFNARYVSFTGWWVLYENEAYNANGATEIWTTFDDASSDSYLPTPFVTFPAIQSIRRLGPRDTDDVSVTCYGLPNFGGFEELTVLTQNNNIAAAFTIESLFFTGRATWEFFPSPDFVGNPVRITATGNYTAYQVLPPQFPAGQTVRSIRRVVDSANSNKAIINNVLVHYLLLLVFLSKLVVHFISNNV